MVERHHAGRGAARDGRRRARRRAIDVAWRGPWPGPGPADLEFGGNPNLHFRAQHVAAEQGTHGLEEFTRQQGVDRVIESPQAKHGDDTALRRRERREEGPTVREPARVVGDLALQEIDGVASGDAQQPEERQRDRRVGSADSFMAVAGILRA